MTDMNTTPRRLALVGSYEDRTGRWYVTADRTWKVRINDDHDATAIRDGYEVYRLIGDNTYNTRTSSLVSPSVRTHHDVVALVAQARRAEQRYPPCHRL